ncbi:hypothetical protein GCM10023335_74530 [Streptomyces siamensis]|uniref:Uncharacterized protein n=2 Tax=Streptomyces siamensis TaxID=1274986 RepID=A0ABP9JHY2_9ACTN
MEDAADVPPAASKPFTAAAPSARMGPPGPGRGEHMSRKEVAADTVAEAARRARFGALPERIRLEDTVEERPASAPDPAKDTFNYDEWLVRTCL